MNNLKLATLSLTALLALGCGGGSDGSATDPTKPNKPTKPKIPDDQKRNLGFPYIRMSGDNPVTVSINTTYIDAGATAHDPDDGALTINKKSNVKTSIIGDYTVLYTTKDSDNNQVSQNRVVKVRYPNPTSILKTGQKISRGQHDDGFYQSGQPRNFIKDDSIGIVSEMSTRLMWQDDKAPVYKTQSDAELYCTNLTLGNFIDWRLPTVMELESLINIGNDKHFTIDKAFNNTDEYYWSSTTYVGDSNKGWSVNFSDTRYITLMEYKSSASAVRCVRNF